MIHQYGFRCSLDDFGVGYSSPTLLRELDIDVLKLDRSFFSDLDNRKARNVITSIVQMSEGLGITIVAEGIETKNQICYLDTIKCSTVQGYFFSRPLPVCEFEKWVESFIISDYMGLFYKKQRYIQFRRYRLPGKIIVKNEKICLQIL